MLVLFVGPGTEQLCWGFVLRRWEVLQPNIKAYSCCWSLNGSLILLQHWHK